MSEIEIYRTSDNQIELKVHFQEETVWLSQKMMAELFDKDIDTIGLHLKNIYFEGELEESSTTALFSVVQIEGKRNVNRKIKFYNLDAIISVGYRVNSKKGTQFRQWATNRLTYYLVQGYTLNQTRLEQLQRVVRVIEGTGNVNSLNQTDAKGLLEILGKYARSFVLLSQFDNGVIKPSKLDAKITYEIQYDEAKAAIAELKRQLVANQEASPLFGNEKDDSFKSSLQSIVQTFDGNYLYPSIEEQAAHLLYFVIKNHSFSDGNKRIGAFLFIWFLDKNSHRFKKSGELKINDNGLTALALLVAQSKPEEKDIMIHLIISLICGD